VNAAYLAIGCAFIAIGSASIARSKKAADTTVAKNRRTSGILLMLAGVIFMATGAVAGSA
jgi:hypothetical protein